MTPSLRLLCVLALSCAVAAEPVWAGEVPPVRRGQSLVDALETLRAAGLDVVYSDRLVAAQLRVEVEPGADSAETVARRILESHGLTLETLQPGRFAVVRAAASVTAPRATSLPKRSTAAAGETLEVVTIFASRYRIDTVGLGTPAALERADIAVLPGLDEDLMRVARYLPGTATNGLSARANVRGGRDDETAVWFDGVPLFEPFHFKDYSAILGIIDPAAVDRLDFYSGVFPVRYGDRLSAVMDIAPRLPRDAVHHELGLSLLSGHLLSAGEVSWRGEPVRWLVSSRSSVTQRIAQALGRDDLEPEFSDLLLRGERVQGDWTFTAGVLALNDELRFADESAADAQVAAARYRDGTAWLRAMHESSAGRQFALTVSAAQRRTDREGELQRAGSVFGAVDDQRRIESAHGRAEWRDPAAWIMGAEWLDVSARYDYAGAAAFDPLLAALFSRPAAYQRNAAVVADGVAFAVYGSRLLQWGERWRLDLGLRVDHRDYRSDASAALTGTDLSPRIAVEHVLDARTTLRLSLGRATQGMRPDELDVADGDNRYAPVQRADQIVLAVEHRLGESGMLRAEAYRKDVANPAPHSENLLDPVTLLPELEVDRARIQPQSARLYGIEFSGRLRPSPAWTTWLSYTWSEANERVAGAWVPRSWNQLHSVASGAAWTRGAWELSANLLWHSGWRRTDVAQIDVAAPDIVRNAAQWDDYASLDLRAAWTKPLPRGRLRIWADVSNATQRLNPCCSELAVDRSGDVPVLRARERGWLPRYAIVGATWELP
jgi:hypothetical protein